MRVLIDVRLWNDKALKLSFWCLNIGLAMMTFLSLLPQGIWQTYASANQGYFYARSTEFVQSPIMHVLVWMRVPGDVVFSVGVGAFAVFMYQAFVSRRSSLGGSLKEPTRHAALRCALRYPGTARPLPRAVDSVGVLVARPKAVQFVAARPELRRLRTLCRAARQKRAGDQGRADRRN